MWKRLREGRYLSVPQDMAKRAVGQSVRRWNWAKYSSIDAIQTSAIYLLFISMTFQSEPSQPSVYTM